MRFPNGMQYKLHRMTEVQLSNDEWSMHEYTIIW